MYDFYFGSNKEIEKDSDKYLLSIKRMMPKWMNSIPDSEFLALGDIANKIKSKKSVFVETGCGASTLILLFYAMKNNGKLYTWEINQEKTSMIRSMCNETISRYFKKNINNHWIAVNYLSTSQYAGLKILNELKEKINLFFHDSEHVLDVILKELQMIKNIMKPNSYICIDDANYSFKYLNTAYINMIRKKLSLKPMPEVKNNKSDLFYKEVEKYLNLNFKNVLKIDDSYKKNYKKDIFFNYFSNEFNLKANLKMENQKELSHRFDCWKIS